MSHRQEKDKGVNVQVLLRCRPFSEGELRANTPQVVTCAEFQREVSVTTSVHGKHTERVFTFDKVFGPTTRQRDLYNEAVVPIVNEVLEGFNCTIFAYGQTGTGKTFTMEGECRMSKSGSKGELPQNAGVIPRAVKQIFETLESQNAEYSVKVTFLELYNEEITDLLAPEDISKVAAEEKQRKPLPLMEDGKGGVLVRGLEEEIVTSANEIFTLLERGSAKRRTAETMLNKQSSRSHSLFSITIHIKEATPEGEELIKCGKLNLVDLAGSENVTRAGAGQGRAREAGEINKSLLTLGRVINALLEHQGHIPYRDSKLTRLLRDSLGGRTKTCIIATVAPSVHCLEETLSTLDYAHRAKNIKNKPERDKEKKKKMASNKKWWSEACLMGIDEAGRGPVLGPMVYASLYCPLSFQHTLSTLHFADSKTLKEEKREELFERLKCEQHPIGWEVDVIDPKHLSAKMLRKTKINLNEISHDSAMGLIRRVLDKGVLLTQVYLDTVGDADKYCTKLSDRFPGIKFVVSKKADSLYPVVSGASIVAKVTRDRAVRDWILTETAENMHTNFGSGYPGDPATKAWLDHHKHPVFGFPSLVRFSWGTCTSYMKDGVVVAWEADKEDENSSNNGNGKRQLKLSNVGFTGYKKRSEEIESNGKGRCKFLQARRLGLVTQFK